MNLDIVDLVSPANTRTSRFHIIDVHSNSKSVNLPYI